MINIRRAELSDSVVLCTLIAEAIEDLVYYITGYAEEQAAREQLLRFVCREDTRVSYKNCLVAEENGVVLGMVLYYSGDEIESLDEPLNLHLRELGKEEKLSVECRRGELYLDSLAVLPQARGRGIAAMLLESACSCAREQNIGLVSLLVDLKKPRVQALYERCGFCDDGLQTIAGHCYRRMVRQL